MKWKDIEKGYWKLGEMDCVLAYIKKVIKKVVTKKQLKELAI